MEPTSAPQSSSAIPIAIIIGFAMIAIAIFFTVGRSEAPSTEVTNSEQNEEITSSTPRPVDDSDYIRGNPNAPILLIEYSDYDCPFCKQYHETLNQIMDEYGVTGRVAWVYRQFPLVQIHPNSPKVSQAALCVGKYGGDDAFWEFTDLIFEEREINEPTNVTKIPDYVESVGVNMADYVQCMDNNETVDAVTESIEDGYNIGARGTPYTVLIVGNEQVVINGAQPYNLVKSIIQNLIKQLEGNSSNAG